MRFFVILGLIVVMYGCASITKFHEIDCADEQFMCRESASVENIPTTAALKSVSPPTVSYTHLTLPTTPYV